MLALKIDQFLGKTINQNFKKPDEDSG